MALLLNGGLALRCGRNFASSVPRLVLARNYNVIKGDLNKLAPNVKKFIEDNAAEMKPENIFICDGTQQENDEMCADLVKSGVLRKIPQYKNSYANWTDPADVARVESKTLISTADKNETIPTPAPGIKGVLGQWISPSDLQAAYKERFPGCMKGRTMYVIPYSMGPIGSPLSKIGIELTDSAYVTACMRIMTRTGSKVLDTLDNGEFVKCVHSIGQPLPMAKPPINNWPCNPPKTIITHVPSENLIKSFGSGYGGNSLLGKKCFALRIGSILAKREGWLAEHMLILGITTPKGKKHYIAAALPSMCGKTNLAMMEACLPGFKIECVGDDIAWMRFDDEGRLRAINPEAGFFGVCPGTSLETNPNAMRTMQAGNTLYTNVALTNDGDVFWEGLEKYLKPNAKITSWKGIENWTKEAFPGERAAHANSRFCTPASQCPIIDPAWEDPRGVPIDAIIFGGRRPTGVPLVYEAFNWTHGVFIGSAVKSEATAAAEHKTKVVMHDPFAMRPFFGYNFGHYMTHWLSMQKNPKYKLPRIFHVNWFRKTPEGEFMWPGFSDNTRVLDWIIRRCEAEETGIAKETAIGYVPTNDSINMQGLSPQPDLDALFKIDKKFWLEECEELRKYYDEQLPNDLPAEVANELNKLKERTLKL